jgi:hypothetical protein
MDIIQRNKKEQENKDAKITEAGYNNIKIRAPPPPKIICVSRPHEW